MLDILYIILRLLANTLAIGYFIFLIVTIIEKEYTSPKKIKCRIVFSIFFCILNIALAIFDAVLARFSFLLFRHIVLALIWGYLIILESFSLKDNIEKNNLTEGTENK